MCMCMCLRAYIDTSIYAYIHIYTFARASTLAQCAGAPEEREEKEQSNHRRGAPHAAAPRCRPTAAPLPVRAPPLDATGGCGPMTSMGRARSPVPRASAYRLGGAAPRRWGGTRSGGLPHAAPPRRTLCNASGPLGLTPCPLRPGRRRHRAARSVGGGGEAARRRRPVVAVRGPAPGPQRRRPSGEASHGRPPQRERRTTWSRYGDRPAPTLGPQPLRAGRRRASHPPRRRR